MVRELMITILLSLMIPKKSTVDEVCNQLNILAECGLLTQENRYPDEYASFSITGDGMLAIKLYLAELSRAIKDKKVNEQDIDLAEGNSEMKNYLKGI
jgi:hypothetical protein